MSDLFTREFLLTFTEGITDSGTYILSENGDTVCMYQKGLYSDQALLEVAGQECKSRAENDARAQGRFRMINESGIAFDPQPKNETNDFLETAEADFKKHWQEAIDTGEVPRIFNSHNWAEMKALAKRFYIAGGLCTGAAVNQIMFDAMPAMGKSAVEGASV